MKRLFAVLAIIFATCVPAAASNMAFRYQMPLVPTGVGAIGDNWVGLPFLSPYATVGDLCTLTGLPTGFYSAKIMMIDPTTGTPTLPIPCGTLTAATTPVVPGLCLKIRQQASATSVASILLVGSHDPTLAITIPDAGAGQAGNFWYAVPWNTTAQNMNDLCTQQGLTSTGLIRASFLRFDAVLGAPTTVISCGSLAGGTAVVPPIGQCVRIREPNGPITWVPQTY